MILYDLVQAQVYIIKLCICIAIVPIVKNLKALYNSISIDIIQNFRRYIAACRWLDFWHHPVFCSENEAQMPIGISLIS